MGPSGRGLNNKTKMASKDQNAGKLPLHNKRGGKTFHWGGRRRRLGTNRRDKMLLNTTMWPAFRPHANSLPRAFKRNAIYYSEDVTFWSPES